MNTLVQERLFTEPKHNPEEVLNLAIAFEQEAQQKKTIYVKTTSIKEKPVFAVEKNHESYKCGKKPSTMGHQKICIAKNVEGRNCVKTGHYARMCRMRPPEAIVENKTFPGNKTKRTPEEEKCGSREELLEQFRRRIGERS